MPRNTHRRYTQKGKKIKRPRAFHHRDRSIGMREAMRWLLSFPLVESRDHPEASQASWGAES